MSSIVNKNYINKIWNWTRKNNLPKDFLMKAVWMGKTYCVLL